MIDNTLFNILLNENDKRVVSLCEEKERSVNELAKILKIAPANISTRLPKLEKLGFIKINRQGRGKKTTIKFIMDLELKEFMLSILKAINNEVISQDNFTKLVGFISEKKDSFKPLALTIGLVLLDKGFLESGLRLTKSGEKFLEENDKP